MPEYNGENFRTNEAMWTHYPFLAPTGWSPNVVGDVNGTEMTVQTLELKPTERATVLPVEGPDYLAYLYRSLENPNLTEVQRLFTLSNISELTGGGRLTGDGSVANEDGVDLRDFPNPLASISLEDPDSGGGEGSGQFGAGLTATALQLVRAFIRSPGAITAATWGVVPSWAKTILLQAGIGIGTLITIDMLGSGDENADTGITGHLPVPLAPGQAHLDLPGIHSSAHIVGGWVSNGVQFYRLANGKLGVLKKNGVWKEWKPKKPVVLYAGGTKNIKTLIRADKIITTEGKKLRKYLDRVAPKPRKAREPKIVLVNGVPQAAMPIHHA